MRKLAVEAADNGLLAPELASGIARIKGVRSHGVRVGNWLSLRQAQALLNAPDVTTKKGLRDRAMFATLLGCGLRRSELANLTMKHVQQRDNRWCIVDLVGKHGRVRTIPMPAWRWRRSRGRSGGTGAVHRGLSGRKRPTMIRTVARRLERLEARAAVVRETNSASHTIRFVDPDKRVTSTMHWENGRCVWTQIEDERRGVGHVEPPG